MHGPVAEFQTGPPVSPLNDSGRPLSRATTRPGTTCFSLTALATCRRQIAVKGCSCTLLARFSTPGRPGRWRRHDDDNPLTPGAGKRPQAPAGPTLEGPGDPPLGNGTQDRGNPCSAPQSARKSRRHNPLLSSLLSVVEEIIGFRGAGRPPRPGAATGSRGGCRPGGRSRATREREQG